MFCFWQFARVQIAQCTLLYSFLRRRCNLGKQHSPIWILGCCSKFTFWFKDIVNNNMELRANRKKVKQNSQTTSPWGKMLYSCQASRFSSCTASTSTFNYIFILLVALNFLAHGQFLEKLHRKILWGCWDELYEEAGSRHHSKQLNTFRYYLITEYIVSSPWHDIDGWCRVEENPPKKPSAPVKPELPSTQPAWLIFLWIYQSGQAHGCRSCPSLM